MAQAGLKNLEIILFLPKTTQENNECICAPCEIYLMWISSDIQCLCILANSTLIEMSVPQYLRSILGMGLQITMPRKIIVYFSILAKWWSAPHTESSKTKRSVIRVIHARTSTLPEASTQDASPHLASSLVEKVMQTCAQNKCQCSVFIYCATKNSGDHCRGRLTLRTPFCPNLWKVCSNLPAIPGSILDCFSWIMWHNCTDGWNSQQCDSRYTCWVLCWHLMLWKAHSCYFSYDYTCHRNLT